MNMQRLFSDVSRNEQIVTYMDVWNAVVVLLRCKRDIGLNVCCPRELQ